MLPKLENGGGSLGVKKIAIKINDQRPSNTYRDPDFSPRDLRDSVKVSLEWGGRAPRVEKGKAPSTVPK